MSREPMTFCGEWDADSEARLTYVPGNVVITIEDECTKPGHGHCRCWQTDKVTRTWLCLTPTAVVEYGDWPGGHAGCWTQIGGPVPLSDW